MAQIPTASEKWSGEVGQVALGVEGLSVGGDKGMPFLALDGNSSGQRLLAGEVLDDLTGYPSVLQTLFGADCQDPVSWAQAWKALGADIVCLRLQSTDPEGRDVSPEDAAATVKTVHDACGLPLIVYGCGNPEKDALTLAAVAEAMSGARLLLAPVEEDHYKTVSAAALAHGHAVLAFSNLDINLAKQMNILLSDYGVERKDIVMDPLMAPLGMGLDYSYSVNERIRLAALNGDRMLQCPIICDASAAWQVGDAGSEDPSLGDLLERGSNWETVTGLASLLSGANIIIVRSPRAATALQDAIRGLQGAV
ncbi:MAG: acetyl-CoA decarbonylase/synthase complex subunit delta, partial [Candidatus Methanomethylophilaceae archaeon]|nr:acetyl-CoA decarbonylase/synthase complex subunit delta [Candidatus Methanomethylophilaceae archaeon]